MEAVTSTRSCRAAIARCISELSANTLRQLVDGPDTQLGSVTQLFRSLLDTAQPPPAGTDEGAEEEEQQVRLFPVHSATPSRHVGCFAAAEHRVPSQAEATTKRGSKAAKTGAQKRSKDISDAEGARGESSGLPLQAARQPVFKTALAPVSQFAALCTRNCSTPRMHILSKASADTPTLWKAQLSCTAAS